MIARILLDFTRRARLDKKHPSLNLDSKIRGGPIYSRAFFFFLLANTRFCTCFYNFIATFYSSFLRVKDNYLLVINEIYNSAIRRMAKYIRELEIIRGFECFWKLKRHEMARKRLEVWKRFNEF